jgi:hypothetical protein
MNLNYNKLITINQQLHIHSYNHIIFVFCPPKVGSTSLITSLRISLPSYFTVLHIHDELMLNVLCNIKDITINEIIEFNKNLGKNIYVIDIFRTPIEHKISYFFENISYHFNNTEEQINNYDINLIIQRFNKLFPYLCNTDYYRQIYNIPIIDNFDFTHKYLCQTINNVKYIKLRLDDFDSWSIILFNIFGIPIYTVKEYETNNKTISSLFKIFKNNYKLPINFLNEINNDKLNYYLSTEEKNNYIQKWSDKLCDTFTSFSKEEYIFYSKITTENQIYFNIQKKHYMDEGCHCSLCCKKRNKFLLKVKNKQSITEPDFIIHNIHTKNKKINNNIIILQKKQKKPMLFE